MEYQEGDSVRIKSLRKNGIVVSLLRGGIYKVQIGSLLVNCKASDLAKSENPPILPSSPKKPPQKEPKDREIDLHGMRVDEALKIIEIAIDRGIVDNVQAIKIIHGKGSGRIRLALHNYLKSLTVIASYNEDLVNPGVTWVYL